MTINYTNLLSVLDFRDPSRFIYNADLVTFTEYGAQLRNLIPENTIFGATYTNYSDANYTNGLFSVSGSIVGTVNVQGNKLALVGGQNYKSIDYSTIENFNLGNIASKGQITFQYYPNYSNTPSSTQDIFHLGLQQSPLKNYINIQHTSTGDLLFNIYDNYGELHQIRKNSVIIETAMKPLEFRIVWDYINNHNNSFIKIGFYFEGRLITHEILNQSFNIEDIHTFGFGNNGINKNFYPNFYISSLQIDKIVNVVVFTPGYQIREYLPMTETRYSTTPQKIEPSTSLSLEVLNDIDITANEDPMPTHDWYIAYTFEIDGVEFFFDRTDLTWKEHVSAEQVSDLTYMLKYKNNILSEGVDFKLIPYLVAIKGGVTPQIISATICYDQFIPFKEDYPVALVYGYVLDVFGKPVSNAKIIITPSRSSVSEIGNFILPRMTKTIRTGQNGYWDANLPLSINYNPEILYNFQIMIKGQIVYERANIRISESGTIKYEDLIKRMCY